MPEIDPRVLRDIEQHGWHVVKVMEDEVGPGHAFSLGLWQTRRHPEILAVGPDLDVLHQLVNAVGEEIRDGRRFEAGQDYEGIVQGFACRFRTVHPRNYPDFLGYAGWFYEGPSFEALQCQWPDAQGRFPGDADFPEALARHQPDLSQPFTPRNRPRG